MSTPPATKRPRRAAPRVREAGADYGAGRGETTIYRAPDGTIALDVRLEHETLWLTQEQMAKVFDVKRPAVTKHLSNIFKTQELDEEGTCSIVEHMR